MCIRDRYCIVSCNFMLYRYMSDKSGEAPKVSENDTSVEKPVEEEREVNFSELR